MDSPLVVPNSKRTWWVSLPHTALRRSLQHVRADKHKKGLHAFVLSMDEVT